MSTAPENEFDLEKLFLPAWAQEPSSAKYAKYEGEDRPDRREDRGPRPPRRDRPREGGRGNRPGPGRGGPGRPGGEGRGPRQDQGRRDRAGGERPFARRGEPRERREPPAPLPELNVTLIPDEKGVESLARQIKMTGRAYPLFDIAQMILQKPERHAVVFDVKKNPEGQPIQPLFVCALDDSVWLSQDETVTHVLKKHFTTFYQPERTATEPPKGKYTFVAQCGLSGVILGPPNYHDYQNQLRKLHSERFSRMPFEGFKSRVKIVRDEEVVKKWIDEQSWKTDYICLNLPEPLRLPTMEAVEKHFRETHMETIVKRVDSHRMTGMDARNLRSPDLLRLVRSVWEDQRRFPLQIATVLSQQFAGHGLQFFKVNKTITHVSVARPHFLDLEATPVSEGVKKIVDYVNANPRCNRRQLVEALSPSPALPAEATKEQTAQAHEPTPEQTAVVADLHWLIHQGHVIEFANGTLETAKKPLPKPVKPAPKATASAAPSPAEAEVSGPEPVPAPSAETAVPEVAPEVAMPENAVVETEVEKGPTEAPGQENSSAGDAPVENSVASVESPS